MDIEDENIIEQVTMSDILQLSSWDRPRSISELRGFVDRREIELNIVDDEI